MCARYLVAYSARPSADWRAWYCWGRRTGWTRTENPRRGIRHPPLSCAGFRFRLRAIALLTSPDLVARPAEAPDSRRRLNWRRALPDRDRATEIRRRRHAIFRPHKP